jgi:hypothetical protein
MICNKLYLQNCFVIPLSIQWFHNILGGRAIRPFFTVKKSIQDPGHVEFLPTLNWSFVGRSSLHLLWPVLYSEETLRSLLKSLLKPLLTCYDLYYRRKELCGVTLEATVEEGNSHSGLKNVMFCTYDSSSEIVQFWYTNRLRYLQEMAINCARARALWVATEFSGAHQSESINISCICNCNYASVKDIHIHFWSRTTSNQETDSIDHVGSDF